MTIYNINVKIKATIIGLCIYDLFFFTGIFVVNAKVQEKNLTWNYGTVVKI